MALIRWTPLRGVFSFRDEMDHLLDDFYGSMTSPGQKYDGQWYPAMDLSETENEIVAALELPGLRKEDVKVCVQNDVLTVSGEKKQERTENTDNLHRVERSYGCFKRSVALPAGVDASKVTASFKNGVLKVTLPKQESEKPKEIPIQIS